MSDTTAGGRPRLGGRYDLGELLGRGGMADVRKGTDVRLGRTVAVKLLRTDLAGDPTFQTRFRREAQAAASLNHPAIVSVYDTGEEPATDGSGTPHPYIVMEYVAGRTLRDVIREDRRILPERALEITSAALGALDYSHRAGIIHRDVKPANVMLTPSGDVKVMDFGIARAISDASQSVTQTAAVIGTAQYLSPEQARGETADSRSDVYSTGCLLYELLTGRPPFVGDSPVAVAYQHVSGRADPPSALDGELSPEIDAIVMHALAKPVGERYQSAAAMQADIDRYLAGQAVTAPAVATPPTPGLLPPDTPSAATSLFRDGPPPDADEQEEEQPRRWPVLLVGLAIVLLMVAALVFGPRLFSSAPEERSVPDLSDLTRAQAARELEEEGLTVGSVRRAASDERVGRVIGQNPEAGDFVAPDSEVDLVLSRGPAGVVVPSVVGDDKDLAAAEIRDADLVPELVREQSDAEVDSVVRTDPEAAVSVAPGSTVTVYWSAGPRDVPSVVGLQQAAASARLERAGFEVELTFDAETVSEPGLVLAQSPEAFSPAAQGSTVLLTVSDYEPEPEPIPVPSATPSPTPRPSPSPTPTPRPSPSPTPTPSPTPSPSPVDPPDPDPDPVDPPDPDPVDPDPVVLPDPDPVDPPAP